MSTATLDQTDERTVSEFLSSKLVSVDMEVDGIVMVFYLCEVIDSQGNRCHCDGYEIKHMHYDDAYGATWTPLTTFVEWRD